MPCYMAMPTNPSLVCIQGTDDYLKIFDYNVCCCLLELVVLLDAVAAEGMSVEEHGEDDDDDDEEEEREDDDGDVGHDLDAAVAHLHHLQ